jgi:L,D-peptidoglycan transpeptidase YkuD (ErfK/YbiS/YcfS/YnhG family)
VPFSASNTLMVFRIAFLFVLLSALVGFCAEESSIPRGCQQIIAVVTPAWDSPTGRMWRLEREGASWLPRGEAVAVTVGQRGLGIGLGLHPDGLVGPLKVEGDKRAPAGVFAIESAFGTKARSGPRFPYRETTAADRWVDDPGSSHYNQWVREDDPGIRKDWKSAEILRRPDGIYDLVLVVGHNRGPVVEGRGSAIFMHRWSAVGRSTIGCTAMAQRHLEVLFGWIDAEKRPLLVQVPRELISGVGLPENLRGLLESLDAR